MLMGDKFEILAGEDVVNVIRAERAERVRPSTKMPGCYESESLCAHQRSVAARGFLGAEIMMSLGGYTVRYDSGLQNFGLLAGTRSGQLDGTLEAAIAWAKRWQAQDPTRRYVWTRRRG